MQHEDEEMDGEINLTIAEDFGFDTIQKSTYASMKPFSSVAQALQAQELNSVEQQMELVEFQSKADATADEMVSYKATIPELPQRQAEFVV